MDLLQEYVHDLCVLHNIVVPLFSQFIDYLEGCKSKLLRYVTLVLEYVNNDVFDSSEYVWCGMTLRILYCF